MYGQKFLRSGQALPPRVPDHALAGQLKQLEVAVAPAEHVQLRGLPGILEDQEL